MTSDSQAQSDLIKSYARFLPAQSQKLLHWRGGDRPSQRTLTLNLAQVAVTLPEPQGGTERHASA